MHFGHLLAAQDAYEQHQLDRLFLVPAAQAPLKPNDVQSSAEDRLAMLRAATEWDHRFAISSTELRDRTRRRLSLDYFVPHKAIVYIQQHQLYRNPR